MIQRSVCLPSLSTSLLRAPSSSSASKMREESDDLNAFPAYQIGAYHGFASQPGPSTYSDDEYADVDWDNIGFGLMPTDYMYVAKCSQEGNFRRGKLTRYGNIELSPSAGVLNYGQGLFEGTKAYRKKENGHLLLFRPEQNAIRMQNGAERMCMSSPSIDQFVNALKQTALANKRWVPPPGRGSLYLRPLLIGTGPVLGLAPAPEYTFLIYASPVRNYFKEGSAPLNLYVEEDFDRASRRGTGGVKTISNYAPVLKAQMIAKKRGFSDVLYLDSVSKKNLEEVSSCNIFIAKVEECNVAVDELMKADEVFCTGTAVGVAPVGSITYQGTRMEYKTGKGTICKELNDTLIGIQTGLIPDQKGWVIEID